VKVFGIDRDEGDGQGSFSHQSPPEIGDSKGDEEGIGRHPCPKEMGDDHISKKSKDTAEESPHSYGGSGFCDFMILRHITNKPR